MEAPVVMPCRIAGCPEYVPTVAFSKATRSLDCYLHAKYRERLLEPTDQAVRKALGLRHTAPVPKLRGLSPADVVSDERLALDELIRLLA